MSAAIAGARVARFADGREEAVWSREAVALRLADAARTLKALPATDCFPQRLAARWPAVVRGLWEVWNALDGESARRRYAEGRHEGQIGRAVPGAAAIDAMDEALSWIGWLEDRRHARALWALALGLKPGRVGRELGVTRQTVAVWQRDALELIARRLNAQPLSA
jgi:hypothetical protein